MTEPRRPSQLLLEEASIARKAGRIERSEQLVRQILTLEPSYAAAWNLLGLIQSDMGRAVEAEASFGKSAELDSSSPAIWFNLSQLYHRIGDQERELAAINEALTRDPYFLAGILAKGSVLRRLGREHEALQLYRLLFDGLGDQANFPEPLRTQLAEARALLDKRGTEDLSEWQKLFVETRLQNPSADLQRVEVYAHHRAGLRKIYSPRPVNSHFPFLPAFEFFPRDYFPWLEQLEESIDIIREELLSIDGGTDFRPYIKMQPGEPVAQWKDLNHSDKWTSFFLWENGERCEQNIERCRKTAAILQTLPMLDMPGKAPTAMFSILQPRTRIPPHTGSTNTRVTIHLPLIVPPGCGFRVGGETRHWVEGEAWAFDDTIEHEAWNNSDQRRAILIIDAWNPLLSEAEKAIVRAIG